MDENLIRYLNESLGNKKLSQGNFFDINGISLYIADHPPGHINIHKIFNTISKLIPPHLLTEFDYISYGDIPEFEQRQINALTRDGVIYITSRQDDNQDAIDDLVHEIAHTLEGKFGYEIYADGRLEREFLAKRASLLNILTSHGIECDKTLFLDPEHSELFDKFLYEEVGYPLLTNLSMGLFMSPYGATSIREYWAESFEKYFLNELSQLKNICPIAFMKVEEITQDD